MEEYNNMTGKEALENYKDIITENKKLKETIKVLTCTNDSAIIQNLKAENQELKEQLKLSNESQETVINTMSLVDQENEKLKKALEDLEEQSGCPLEALLSKSAMVVIDGVTYEVNIMAVSFTNGNIYFGSEWNLTTRKIKDYGKTWWLKESEVKQDK